MNYLSSSVESKPNNPLSLVDFIPYLITDQTICTSLVHGWREVWEEGKVLLDHQPLCHLVGI